MKKLIVLASLNFIFTLPLLFNCGGGGGGSEKAPDNNPPAFPNTVTLTPAYRQLIVNWEAVTNADTYEVWYSRFNNPFIAEQFMGDNNSSDTTCIITELNIETYYYVWIKAVNSYGVSDFSASAYEKTAAICNIPGIPEIIPSTQQLTLTWSPVDDAESYQIYYNTSNDSGSAIEYTGDIIDSDTTCTITGLTDGTSYYLWIKASNNYGTTDFSPFAYGIPPGIHAQWAKTVYSAPDETRFDSLSVSSSGIFSAGYFYGESTAFNFGNGVTITNTNTGSNILLVKYNTNGDAQWAATAKPSDNGYSSKIKSVAADSSYVYAAGTLYGNQTTFNFGNGVSLSLSAVSVHNYIVLIKYDTNGNIQWAKTASGANHSFFESVTVGSDGIYASGYIYGAIYDYNFGNGVQLPVDGYPYGNVLLVKYNTSGNAQWAITIDGPHQSCFSSVTAGSNRIYAAGYITSGKSLSSYDFGNNQKIHFGNGKDGSRAVLVKYDQSGQALWARALYSESCFNSVKFGGSSIYAAGTNDSNGIINKYDTDGNVVWSKTVVNNSGESSFKAVSFGSDGIYVTGSLDGNSSPYNFGNGVAITFDNNIWNIIVVKYDENGNAQWVKALESQPSSYASFNSISAGSYGIYTAGNLSGNSSAYDFGNGKTILRNSVGNTIVIVKYQ